MKTILITGASTGIGKSTAIYFAEKGWNVAATMRTPSKGTELLKYPNIKIFKLDVMDEAGIHQAIDDAKKTFGGIDVLYNNAGYALVGAFEAMTQEQIKRQFDTNVFGVMNVTKAILPYFREKKNGTIITTTSVGGIITFPLYSIYHSTKWAVEGFMESLQFELRQFNIKLKNIEPGPIKTEFENSSEFVTHVDYDKYVPKVYQNMMESYTNAPTGEVVAKKVFQAANDTSFRLRYPADRQAKLFIFLRKRMPTRLFLAIMRKVLEKGVKK